MKNEPRTNKTTVDIDATTDSTTTKPPFVEPKLTYVEPTVETHPMVDVTAGFFATFYP